MDLISVDKPYDGMKAKIGDVVYVRRRAGESHTPPQEVVHVGKGAFVVESPEGELTVYGKNTTGMSIFSVERMLVVNGFEVPAPLEEDPGEGRTIYVADPMLHEWCFVVTHLSKVNRALLVSRGLAHTTKAAAAAHAKAMVWVNPTAQKLLDWERKSLDDAYDNLP